MKGGATPTEADFDSRWWATYNVALGEVLNSQFRKQTIDHGNAHDFARRAAMHAHGLEPMSLAVRRLLRDRDASDDFRTYNALAFAAESFKGEQLAVLHDLMDVVWQKLSDEERDQLNNRRHP